MIQNQKAHTNSSQYVVKFANKEPKKIPDLVLKNLFSLIYIHKPKSYESFCNILEDYKMLWSIERTLGIHMYMNYELNAYLDFLFSIIIKI